MGIIDRAKKDEYPLTREKWPMINKIKKAAGHIV